MDANELIEMDAAHNLGDFYAGLTRAELKKVQGYIIQLREDSDHRLTHTEEQEFAKMMWFIDKVSAMIAEKGIGGVDPGLVDTMRQYQTAVVYVMRKTRESGEKPPSIIDELKKGIGELEGKDGKVLVAWERQE